jgi:hypothetical protein
VPRRAVRKPKVNGVQVWIDGPSLARRVRTSPVGRIGRVAVGKVWLTPPFFQLPITITIRVAGKGRSIMAMRTLPTNLTIASYAEQLSNKQIVVNHNYQRSDKVWPVSAKSNLIDTILAGYPIPKLILSQRTDLITRRTRQELVDGQQRTAAITEFLGDKFAVSRGEFAGLRFDDLDNPKKRDFLDYELSADIFTSATDEDIREVFRRINSYQVPLNKQETRHATHQGEFKWFIRDLGTQYATSFVKTGLLTERQVTRMTDLEFLTELVQLIKSGVKTASPGALNALYRDNDQSFPDKDRVQEQISYGLGEIINLSEIHNTALMSRANIFSLFGAFTAIRFMNSPVSMALEPGVERRPFTERANLLTNLTALADALEDNADGPFYEFVSAAKQGTNTEKNRTTRLRWFYRALTLDRL